MIDGKNVKSWVAKAQKTQAKIMQILQNSTPETVDKDLIEITSLKDILLSSAPHVDIRAATKTLGKHTEEAKEVKSLEDVEKLKKKINGSKSKGNKS